MAVAALAVEFGLIGRRDDEPLVLETAVGLLRATCDGSVRDGARVSLTGCPAFVLRGGVELTAHGRSVRADLAYGGCLYAIVDSEAAGVPIDGAHDAELRRMARGLADAVSDTFRLADATPAYVHGLRGVVFTAPADRDSADFRIVTVTTQGRISRGASGTGLAAVLGVLGAMGLPIDDQGVTLEGGVGSTLHADVAERVQLDEYEAIVPRLRGTVWLTGEHTFVCDEGDPLAKGFVRG